MIRRGFFGAFRAILADRTALLLLVGSAILYSFFYPTAYSGEVPTQLPIVAVDMDHSGSSRSLLARLPALQQADLASNALLGHDIQAVGLPHLFWPVFRGQLTDQVCYHARRGGQPFIQGGPEFAPQVDEQPY